MKVSFLLLSLFLTISASAQEATANWFTNLEEAQAYSEAEEVPILMVFAGSDWCRPCMQFKKSILEDSDFARYANQNLAILYLDFPSRKKNKLSAKVTVQNERLAEQYNRNGSFPKIIMLDSTEQVLSEIDFTNQLPQAFQKTCEQVSQQKI